MNRLNTCLHIYICNVGREYNQLYFLVDGIYYDWPVFVKTISNPGTEQTSYFATCQEGVRKDIERAFGNLQIQYQITKDPSLLHDQAKMKSVIEACIVLCNINIEAEQAMYKGSDMYVPATFVPSGRSPLMPDAAELAAATIMLRNPSMAKQLRDDLVQHLLHVRGQRSEVGYVK